MQYYGSLLLNILDISLVSLQRTSAENGMTSALIQELFQEKMHFCCQWTQFTQILAFFFKIELQTKSEGWIKMAVEAT